ncbi:MAG: Cache 3/Cache 2 fusion domain-containing protein [Chloroflexota bacterium]
MSFSPNGVGLRGKILALGAVAVLVPSILLVAVQVWQSGDFGQRAIAESKSLVDADLDHIATSVYALVKAQDEALRGQVDHAATIATAELAKAGGAGAIEAAKAGSAAAAIAATTGTDASLFTLAADGSALTLVGTTLKDKDGNAIAETITATGAGGGSDPQVAAAVAGKPYAGVSIANGLGYVVNDQPITDASGKTVGVLEVAVGQQSNKAFRDAILGIKVGKSGYVYVLGGTGADKGHYIVSAGGKRDGENILDLKAPDGTFPIQQIVAAATTLEPGKLTTVRYPWQNSGDPAPREKFARLAYYAPWDWVIGASSYEDDFAAVAANIEDGRRQMLLVSLVAALVCVVVGGTVSVLLARSLIRRVKVVEGAVLSLAQNDAVVLDGGLRALAENNLTVAVEPVTQAVPDLGTDEIGAMGREANALVERLTSTMAAYETARASLTAMIREVSDASKFVTGTAGQLNVAASQTGIATQQVALTMQQVAGGAHDQAETAAQTRLSVDGLTQLIHQVGLAATETSERLAVATQTISDLHVALDEASSASGEVGAVAAEAALATAEGLATVSESADGMTRIKQAMDVSAHRVASLGDKSEQIGEIVETINDIAEQTNLLALNAAIEAARAGEAGKGFAVVADEVRKLAERSGRATKEIASLIEEVQRETAAAVEAMRTGSAEVESGATLADASSDALGHIAMTVSSTKQSLERISTAIGSMGAALEKVIGAAGEIGGLAAANSRDGQEMNGAAAALTSAVDDIAAVSQENSAAAEEVSAATEEMSAQAQEVVTSAAQLSEMAARLDDLVSAFVLDEGQAAPASAPAAPASAPAAAAPARIRHRAA